MMYVLETLGFLSIAFHLVFIVPAKADSFVPRCHTVQTGSFLSRQNADDHRDQLENTLDPQERGQLRIDFIHPYHAVRIGCFKTLEDAESLRQKLRARLPGACVVKTRAEKGFAAYPETDRNRGPAEEQVAAGSMESSPKTPDKALAPGKDEPPEKDPADPVALGDRKEMEPAAGRSEPSPDEHAPGLRDTGPEKGEPARPLYVKANIPGKFVRPKTVEDSPEISKSAVIAGGSILLAAMVWGVGKKRTKTLKPVLDPLRFTNEKGRLPEEMLLMLKNSERNLSLLRGNLLRKNGEIKSFYISSCFNGEGKTTAAIHLAWILASIGESRVLLVDWNPDNPSLHHYFNIREAPGVSDYLNSKSMDCDFIHTTRYRFLDVLVYGSRELRPDGLTRDRFKEKIERLHVRYDYIVYDGQSLFDSMSTIFAEYFDGVIMVVEAEKTKWEVLQTATARMSNINGNILGTVLNRRKFYIPRILYNRI